MTKKCEQLGHIPSREVIMANEAVGAQKEFRASSFSGLTKR
jgi:hypothetical protein